MNSIKTYILLGLVSILVLFSLSCDLSTLINPELTARKVNTTLLDVWYPGEAIDNEVIGNFPGDSGLFGYQSYSYGLWAGKDKYAGLATIWNDTDTLFITIDTDSSADIQSVHIDTYINSFVLPTKRPSPGKAQFKYEDLQQDRVEIDIPFSDIGIPGDDGTELFCIIHVDLVVNNTINDEYSNLDNNGESAYIAGLSTPDYSGNSAWFFVSHFKILKVERYPENNPPSAAFSRFFPDFNNYTPCKVVFDASYSTDPDDDILTYEWDFGDGSTGIGMIVENTYTQEYSDFEITLTVSDGRGGSDSFTDWVSTLGPIQYTWYEDADGDGWGNYWVSITSESPIQPDGYVSEDKAGDCDDTNPEIYPGAPDPGNIDGVFYGDGIDNDCDGLIDEDTGYGPPLAIFAARPNPVIVDELITFDASASYHRCPYSTIQRYEWDFDMTVADPSYFELELASHNNIVQHRYEMAGTFIVGLKVIDNLGVAGYAFCEFTVISPTTLTNPTITPTQGPPNTSFTITDLYGRMVDADRIIFTAEDESPELGTVIFNFCSTASNKMIYDYVPWSLSAGNYSVTVHNGDPALNPPLFEPLLFIVE